MLRGGFKKYLVVVLFFLLCPISAHAASLYLSPASGSYALNSNIAVSVYVSSADKAMNAVSGALDFPADKLQVVSISKSGSVINLWVAEPAYSNANGTVNFEGVALNPGYTGSNGKIITVNFRVKSVGDGEIIFLSGSVLANDGQGTEILKSSSGAQFTLGEGKPVPLPEPEVVPPGKPATPDVSSPTHPDSAKWYAVKDAKFIWNLPVGVTKARLLVDAKPDSSPSVVYSPAISEKETKEIDDGEWYFHVQLYNEKGWGGTTHFRFSVDTTNPTDLKVKEITRVDQTDPRPIFTLAATDSGSGLDYYEIRVDNNEPIKWKDDGAGRYAPGPVKPGRHILTVRAFDHAGNFALESLDFEIKSLIEPTVESYPDNLRVGEPLAIIGKTYPDSQVSGYLRQGAREPTVTTVTSDESGRFIFAPSEEMRAGSYEVWFEVISKDGARSAATKKFNIFVSEPAILRIGSLAVNVLAVIIPLIALVIMLIGTLWYGTHRFRQMRQSLRLKTNEVGLARRAFDALLVGLQSEINALERAGLKRKLTAEEAAILAQLKKDFGDAQRFLGRPSTVARPLPKIALGSQFKSKKR